MKFKNILFVFVFIMTMASIMLFNYAVDPYYIFRPNIYKKFIFDTPSDLFYTSLKAYKKFKYEKFAIGSSDVQLLFGKPEIYRNKLFALSIANVTVEQRYQILEDYLELHPETKEVFLIFPYDLSLPAISVQKRKLNKKELLQNGYTIKELSTLLLSVTTINDSIDVITFIKRALPNIFKHNLTMEQRIQDVINLRYKTSYMNIDDITYQTYPKRTNSCTFEDKQIKEHYEKTILYVKKMIDLLKNKNIQYKIIIPPYHALHNSIFYTNKKHYEVIKNFKRFLLSLSDEIYDFNFINKYTTVDFYKDNYWYSDYKHIQPLFGAKIYNYFFDEKNKEEDICLVLTKDNIENMLEYESELLKDYTNENQDKVNDSIKIYKNQNTNDIMYNVKFHLKDLPEDYKNKIKDTHNY